MDKTENVMQFVAEYSADNDKMPAEALEELKDIMVNYFEMEDNQQLCENYLQAMLEASKGQLEIYGKVRLLEASRIRSKGTSRMTSRS